MEIKRFLGIKNTTSDDRLKPGELASATDVDIDNTGRILSREGFTLIDATAAHSVFSDENASFIVHGSTLKAVNSDLTFTALRTLSNSNPVSFASHGGVTYYSNGTDTGRISGGASRQWGVTPPASQPSAAPAVGSLPPGKYLYALTFVRTDGHESGTGLAGAVDLPLGGGIDFSNIEVSTNPEVNGRIVYLSSPNGEVLFRAVYLDNVVTGASYYGDTSDFGTALITQFSGPPPAGSMVRYYNGCMYVVVGNVVFYSDAYEFERFRLDKGYLQYPLEVGMFECVNSGVYLGTCDSPTAETGETWYLSGGRPDQLNPMKIYDFGVIRGTAIRTEAAHFQPQGTEGEEWSRPAVVWATRHGVCLGLDGGSATNLTENRYSFPVAQQGAGVVRQTRGYTQFLVVLRGAGAANNIAP